MSTDFERGYNQLKSLIRYKILVTKIRQYQIGGSVSDVGRCFEKYISHGRDTSDINIINADFFACYRLLGDLPQALIRSKKIQDTKIFVGTFIRDSFHS